MNFNELYMKFYNRDALCTIRGKKTDSIDLFDATRLDKLLRKRNAIASIHLCSMSVDAPPSSPPLQIVEDQVDAVNSLLNEFVDVFAMPMTLPQH